MDFAAVRTRLAAFPGAVEGMPFGPDVLVFKVAGKMFALLPIVGEPPRVNLKCDPMRALALRAEFASIQPGYHQDKKHWNTVLLDVSVPAELVVELVEHSYALVVAGLTRAQRAALSG